MRSHVRFRKIQQIKIEMDDFALNDENHTDYELVKEYKKFIKDQLDLSTVWVLDMEQNEIYQKSSAILYLLSKFLTLYF